MSTMITKGSSFSGKYTSPAIASATDWTGVVEVYKTYPGTLLSSVPLTLNSAELHFVLAPTVTGLLDRGGYIFVMHTMSASLGVDTYRMDYFTVVMPRLSMSPFCTVFGSIEKGDGSPPGVAVSSLMPTAQGLVLTPTWKGIPVTGAIPVNIVDGERIVSTESITVETDATGYFELDIIRGVTVKLSCSAFSGVITIDTTGLDEIDVSEFI